ncbi:MAG: GNAT family N-acetyltransferase [Bacteroidales bacterium]|nr:GNAT family N-acetyltransferase [Bacteroidales bacterium]MBD5205827.1 GNAT family N-acetyltransferase [Bacteroidales bacterium]MBD5302361.1 GNAT family N-acetyltransferase [Bacteroides sp.]
MKDIELKKRLSQLWKDTFHDSDEYISLIFDNYFDENLCAYEVIDGEVVAGLLGVPYDFGNSDNKVSGLYLCGLATKPKYRSRGLMTKLLSEINQKAKESGYAFTFLIPADMGLRKYYHDREYVNAFYRIIDNYTSVHDFDIEYEAVLQEHKNKAIDIKRRYYASLKVEEINIDSPENDDLVNAVIKMIMEQESSQDGLQIIHSEKDLYNIIKENIISSGTVFVVHNTNGEVTGVAFTTVAENGSVVNIHKMYVSDIASRYKAMSAIKTKFEQMAIKHYVSTVEMDRKALWSRSYGSYMADAAQVPTISVTERVYSLADHAKVYGMVKVLDLPEILKFQANVRRDLKYSILAKGEYEYTFDKFDVRDGKLFIKQLSMDNLTPSQAAYVMSKRDICEIVFRRRDTDNLVTEAFGIPSINASISLLLD